MASAKVKISYQEGKGFKKYIGHVLSSGKRTPKMWYLGHYEKPAKTLAAFIVAEWKALKAAGVDHWTTEALERIEEAREGTPGEGADTTSKQSEPTKPKQAKSVQKTTHQAIDLYKKYFLASQKRAASTKNTMVWRLATIKNDIPDVPLNAVGASEITEWVSHYMSLPNKKGTKTPISPDTADHSIKALKQIFDFCDLQEMWRAPRRFADLFKVTPKKANNGGKAIQVFDIFELKALWDGANDNQKVYLLLMLNCAFTSIDISSLKYVPSQPSTTDADDYPAGETFIFPNEFYGANVELQPWEYSDWIIAGKRTKTNVFGMFKLWPETAKLLAARMKKTPKNKEHLAILGEGGLPLWHLTDNKDAAGRTDAIGLVMRRLIRAVAEEKGCRILAAKSLRKKASQMIRDISGLEVSQIMLRQTGRSVAEKHYNNASFEKLSAALVTMREQLGTMFGE